MISEGTHESKPAAAGFGTDVLLAAHAVIHRPIVALVSISLSCSVVLVALGADRAHSLRFIAIAMGALLLFQLGWFGSERVFFRRQFEGATVDVLSLVYLVNGFIGRFLALGLLVLVASLPLVGLPLLLGYSTKHPWPLYRLASVCFFVALDFTLTFVTPALALTTRSLRGALRIGVRMLRKTWPRCALYALFPPLALQVNSFVYPASLPALQVIVVAGLTVVGLLAKGAAVAFYLREVPVPGRPTGAS